MIKVAINGYGRIGRNILRAHFEHKKHSDIQIVAINDLGSLEDQVYLTKYDSVHGRFNMDVSAEGDYLVVNGNSIRVTAERDPNKLPWKELDIDVVLECTGLFASRDKSMAHINAGAKKVVISAPGGEDVDATIVYGVNHDILRAEDKVISNASCTTNCLAPLIKPLFDTIGIEHGLMNTIHAFTNDQMLVDSHHKDSRRGRAASLSMIPTQTGAAKAIGLVIPELVGKLDGFAVRVPTANVSLVDLTFVAQRETSVDEVNDILRRASENELKGV